MQRGRAARATIAALSAWIMYASAWGCARQPAGAAEPRTTQASLRAVELPPELEPMLDACIAGEADVCDALGRYLAGGVHPHCVPADDDPPGMVGACRIEAIPFELPERDIAALYGQAARLRARACDAGEADACDALAQQIEAEHGFTPDPQRAADLRARALGLRTSACDAGEADACLAQASVSGGARARDYEHRACAAGDMQTCAELMRSLAGRPPRPDMRERERFVEAYWKHQAKLEGMGSLLGGEPDAPFEAFEARCKAKKDAEACYVASHMVGMAFMTDGDAKWLAEHRARCRELGKRAEQLFERDCEAGDARACWSRGHMHEEHHETELARERYEQACAADGALGCLARARQSLAQAERPADMGAAMEWLERSCALEPSLGCGELALIHECGLGTERDRDRAAQLYTRACVDVDERAAACLRARALRE